MTRDEIFSAVVDILVDNFELDANDIKGETTLYEELDLDSIDAVDIFVALRDLTGRRPDPEKAKAVRTVDELVAFVEQELADKAAGKPEPATDRPSE